MSGQLKIKDLTEEQKRELEAFRLKWWKIGTLTKPINHKKAEAVFSDFYGFLHRPFPKVEWKVPSESNLWSDLGSSLGLSLGLSLWSSLGLSLRLSLRSSLGSSLGSNLRSSLWSDLGLSLGSSLRSDLGLSLGSSLRSSLWSSLWSDLGLSLWSSFGGQIENYWIAYYLFAQECLGVKYESKDRELLDLWRRQAEECFLWWPYENKVIAFERPTKISFDRPFGALHNETGKAVEFSEDWDFWAWHGVKVPQKLIEKPDEITAKEFIEVTNAEVRRAYIEKLGAQRIIKLLGAKMTAVEDNVPGFGRVELWKAKAPGIPDGFIQYMKVWDFSTGKAYFLRVNPKYTSPKMVAWRSYHVDKPENYQVVERT